MAHTDSTYLQNQLQFTDLPRSGFYMIIKYLKQ